MDPGPYGCLGAGPGQAIGAKTAHPDRQVVCMLGDGALGFSGLEFDTMARHNLPVVGIIGNNGIWALEYHPMRFLYGYEVAASLRPATRYDEVVKALGGARGAGAPSERAAAILRSCTHGKLYWPSGVSVALRRGSRFSVASALARGQIRELGLRMPRSATRSVFRNLPL